MVLRPIFATIAPSTLIFTCMHEADTREVSKVLWVYLYSIGYIASLEHQLLKFTITYCIHDNAMHVTDTCKLACIYICLIARRNCKNIYALIMYACMVARLITVYERIEVLMHQYMHTIYTSIEISYI